MTFVRAVMRCLGSPLAFGGRAGRREFWFFLLFAALVTMLLAFAARLYPAADLVIFVAFLGLLVPLAAVGSRRLHDTKRGGHWLLLALVPVIGQVVLVYWLAERGTPGRNRFGKSPRSFRPRSLSA